MIIGVLGLEMNDATYTLPIGHYSLFTTQILVRAGVAYFALSLILAIHAIIYTKNIKDHHKWMTRHVCAGLAVAAQRMLIFTFNAIYSIITSLYLDPMIEWSVVGKKVFFSYTIWLGTLLSISWGEFYLNWKSTEMRHLKGE